MKEYSIYPFCPQGMELMPANRRFVGVARKMNTGQYYLLDNGNNLVEVWEEYFDPSERFPQPDWFDEAMRRGKE